MAENLTMLTSTTFSKAQIIATRLESSGIGCYLRNINLFQPAVGTGIKIFVNENDLEKSFKILKEFQSEFNLLTNIEETGFASLFVIPIDFSNASLNASYYALELAAKFKVRIKLIHTFGIPDVRPLSFDETNFFEGPLTTHVSDLRQEAEKRLAEFIKTLNQYIKTKSLDEIPISTHLINGIPDDITLYTAESENAGLIIMGIAGTDIRTFEPMGKIASRIVERANIPVMIIPEDTVFKGIDKIKNVLYTTAFDETDFSAIQKLISFVNKLDVNIYCLHIDNKDVTPWDKLKMEGLREYFNKAYGKTNVECDLMISKDIFKALDEFIISNKIDVISINAHKRNLISKLINPSITLKILYHTRIPLLVFHT
jgi:nucleotide-binding universal stress UspA family protein